MKYTNTIRGIFQDRSNRFIAHVLIDGELETVHVKNTGRLGELLLPGAEVILTVSDNPNRKTRCDLIGVCREGLGWVNIDSQAPNAMMGEWLAGQAYDVIKPEYRFGSSRLDYYLEKGNEKILMEVKGCTLEREGLGWFPDAVSVRAHKHLRELAAAASEGYRCVIAFVIAMEGVTKVRPNTRRDPEFAKALDKARAAGVEVWHMACRITEDSAWIQDRWIQKTDL